MKINQTKTVLIVDDEPRTRRGVMKVLDAWAGDKLELITASSAAEAIQVFTNKKVNLIITDIKMPEMTGLGMLDVLKKHKPVVIIMSAYSEFDYAQEAIRLGVVNYLLKPVAKDKLVDAVEKALKEDEMRERAVLMQVAFDEDLVQGKEDGDIEGMASASPIKEVMTYIDDNLDHQLSLSEVAERVHLNPSYLSALFKEKTNLNFSQYVTRSRIQKAKHLLLTTELTINEISEAVGYQTPKYFTRLFKESVEMTPNQFRKEYKKERNVF
ncbi:MULTISPECIES: response regulator transcription factor [Bacillaceae]|uniref:Response regulator n=1 Tax=Evansella alkalicola TaxID=745819 RepID=A0ABS6JSH5_9BACI|nr:MULTISPECIES: response regulator [Bacillaceae]MBU9721526.1 response regulator [Bacillus alkalicola]